MAGKKGRSGRKVGSLSWFKNPVALAGHRLNVLMEMWLVGQPIGIGEKWLAQPTERRYQVPPKTMRVLAVFAIEQIMEVYAEHDLKRPGVDQVLAWARRKAPSITLRRKATAARSAMDERADERQAAYRQYIEDMANAWKGEQR